MQRVALQRAGARCVHCARVDRSPPATRSGLSLQTAPGGKKPDRLVLLSMTNNSCHHFIIGFLLGYNTMYELVM